MAGEADLVVIFLEPASNNTVASPVATLGSQFRFHGNKKERVSLLPRIGCRVAHLG
ncbi:MAG TPA: hypothetical protein PL045_07325 [Chitinophagaceae bacterium]|nr:hypothetical protein [Chitinophagaceae bacterium]